MNWRESLPKYVNTNFVMRVSCNLSRHLNIQCCFAKITSATALAGSNECVRYSFVSSPKLSHGVFLVSDFHIKLSPVLLSVLLSTV